MRQYLRRTRVRLSMAYGGALSVGVILLAVGFWLGYSRLAMSQVDASLAAQASTLLAGVDNQGGQVTFQGGGNFPSESPGGIAIRSGLISADGRVIDSSGSGATDNALLQASAAALAGGAGTAHSLSVGGVHSRVLAQRVDLGAAGTGTLVLSRPIGELESSLVAVAALLGAVGFLLVLLATATGYLLAGRALRPVHVIASTARNLSEQSLHQRIELDLPADELGELVSTFNQMLARLERSFESLRRFTADAAHELRAPLTLLRAEAEVSLDPRRTREELQESMRSFLAETERLSRTAEQLLILARADAGALAAHHETIDLSDLVEETVDRWRTLATGREVTLVVDAPGAVLVDGDNDLLRRVVDNLVDNAVRFSPAGASVGVALVETSGRVLLSVRDSGPGVDPVLRDTLFERFARADPARQRETGGAGLGLALCAAIATAHGGAIRAEAPEGGGARFVMDLPAASTQVA